MFKGLTQRAQKILTILSQEEAKKFHSDQLLPEHVIIAILKDGEGVAIKALQRDKINLGEMQLEIENSIQVDTSGIILGDVPPSREVRIILEEAAKEARDLRHEYIGTEHLLLATLAQKNIISVYVELHKSGYQSIKDAIIKINGIGKYISEQEKSPNQSIDKKTPALNVFSRDLTRMAKENKLDPVIGREKEINRVILILSRRTKNNPVLIGEPGVGKTAIVEGLAQLIIENNVPEALKGKRLLNLDLASMVAGTKYRGEFEERLKKVMKEILDNKNIILFIDELHTIIGAGGAEGSIDASNMLKPALSRGEIQCIGATTLNEYKKYIERNGALARRFQSIFVDQPTAERTIEILKGIKERYADFHGVVYTYEALEAAANLSHRYITDRFLPDKAIDLIDEAGSQRKVSMTHERPKNITKLDEKIKSLESRKQSLVKNQEFEKAAKVRDSVSEIKFKIDQLEKEWKESLKVEKNLVDVEDIQKIISDTTGIPLERLVEKESKRLLQIEMELHKKVISQDEAINIIASSVRRARTGMSSPKRPLGSFIFLGPTGVGKTLLAKTLAEFLFGDEDSLIRIDMSDYMEKHNVSRLVGSPPGYIGYEEGGTLTEKVRRRPYCIILLDEIEKAHPEVFNILLQVLEEGELQDNLGHTVSFRNAVLIMTSNAGSKEISKEQALGFQTHDGILEYEEIKSSAINELKRVLMPEFINRVDEIVVFHSLKKDDLDKILKLMTDEIRDRLKEQNITIEFTKEAEKYIIDNSYDEKYGARPLRRYLQKEVEDQLSTGILRGDFKQGCDILVDVNEEKLSFQDKSKKALVRE